MRGLQDLEEVLKAPSITVLDLSDNKIEDISLVYVYRRCTHRNIRKASRIGSVVLPKQPSHQEHQELSKITSQLHQDA